MPFSPIVVTEDDRQIRCWTSILGKLLRENHASQIRVIIGANPLIQGILTQFSRIREHTDDRLITGVADSRAGGRRAADGSFFQGGIEHFIDLEPGTLESQDALVHRRQLGIHQATGADRSDLDRILSIIHSGEAIHTLADVIIEDQVGL